MPQPIRTREEWEQIHTAAIALGSIRKAAKAHGVSEDAAYQRARREGWLVGTPASIQAARAQRIERAEAAGVAVSERVRATPGPDILHREIHENGRQTRAMLAQALNRAAGQARRTKHPLARARHIRDVASAAAIVHPDQFREGAPGGSGQDAAQAILASIFGRRTVEQWEKNVTPPQEDTGEQHSLPASGHPGEISVQ
ncbi:MAG: hypothetical protein ABSE62_00635 [Chthoniobacteraceae bacterium]|jgi:DNA-binding helix-hairpin-helix protein with protein kinase domain